MTPGKGQSPLKPDNGGNKITHLEEQIQRLSSELKEKEDIIAKLMDIATGQYKRIASLNSALMDTVVWDPQATTHPSCSTPHSLLPRDDSALYTNHRKGTSEMPPRLTLTNRCSALASDSPALPASAQALPNLDSSIDFPTLQSTVPVSRDASPPQAIWPEATAPPSINSHKSTIQRPKSSARRKILKEAVLRRSSGSQAAAPALPLHSSLRAHSPPSVVSRSQTVAQPMAPRSPGEPRLQQAAVRPVVLAENAPLEQECTADGSVPGPAPQPEAPVSCQPSFDGNDPQLTNPPTNFQPQPLFPPKTVIIGDSIIRHVRYFNTITHCFPGATVSQIMRRLPDLLQSMPSSIYRIIVHVGTNDISLGKLESTKRDFEDLFRLLKPWTTQGMSVFISGPIPTQNHGAERLDRTLQLNTWLSSVCRSHLINFIDNFNLFWDRPSHYRADGLHLNRRGSRLFKNYMVYAVHNLISVSAMVPARE
ncbi:hypothetical protein NL108_018618 [Boleophthalmus pectinirostris]|nr:hypothetical protein NL108_018618 [Boleophthalmus pectinirostris]